MKKYVVRKEFYSPRVGNAIKGKVIEFEDEKLAQSWIDHGFILPYDEEVIETKPKPVEKKKETKPRKTKVKNKDDSL